MTSDQQISQELLRSSIERKLDDEFQQWRKNWERKNGKITPGVKTSYFRNRLVQVLFVRALEAR